MIYAFILEIVGLIFIYLEFFMPGGVMAICGGSLVLSSLGLFYWQEGASLEFFIFLGVSFFSLFAVCRIALWQIKKTKQSLYLSSTQEGFSASSFEGSLVGKKGVCSTDLKPAGYILVEGSPYQALSESGYLSKDSSIVIVGGRGSYYIIKEG